MKISSVSWGALALALAAGNAAFAQSVDNENEDSATAVDEVVVTGMLSQFGVTKSNTPILETARSVSVETEEMFRAKGALTLDDALTYTAGVSGDTYGFATRGDFATVRGLDVPEYRDNIQVLFGFYNNTRSDIYMLEQVEVLKGPASVLYGRGSPGGIVNVVSKIANPEPRRELVVEYGSYDRFQVGADINGPLFGDNSGLSGRVVALYRDSDTQIDYVNDDSMVISPSLTWQPAPSTRFTVLAEFQESESDTAGQFLPLTGTYLESASGEEIEPSTYLGHPDFNKYDTDSVSLTLMGSHELNEIFSVEGTARYKNGMADYSQRWVSFAGAGVPRIDAAGNGLSTWYAGDASSQQLSADVRLRAQFQTGMIRHELLAGVNAQDVQTDSDVGYYFGEVINVFNPVYGPLSEAVKNLKPVDTPPSTTEDLGVYINDQVSIGNLFLNGGVRFDTVESDNGSATQEDDATSFSVGAIYKFDMGLSPYVSYAESFEPVLGVDTVTGDNLKPQEGRQYEAGLKYQPPGTRTYITAAYFDIEQSNLSNPVALPTAPSQQEGVAKITGFELEALTTLGDWYLEGNFSALDTEDPNGVPLSSIPETQASAWAMYQPEAGPLANFRAGFGLRYAGENESNGINPFTGERVQIVNDSYTVADAMIGYRAEGWDFTVNVRNLADKEYFATCLARGDCFPGEGRTVVARLAKRF